MTRDYSTISPTARSLLFLKARKGIPYARQAVEALWGSEWDAAGPPDERSRLLARHFANRYQSVGELARTSGPACFVELSSGFSFRGLEFTQSPGVDYLDTDLPAVIADKRALAEIMAERNPQARPLLGSAWQLEPLNVLDSESFSRLDSWGTGPICVVNEGLLVYFDDAEKRALCHSIHALLARRGGCWVTGDIYVRREGHVSLLLQDEAAARFHAEHRTEENKFSSFEDAETFFFEVGFKVAARAPAVTKELGRQTWTLVPRLN